MKAKEITLEFVNENFYECEGKVCRKDGIKCKNTLHQNYYILKFKTKRYLVHRILWILYNQKSISDCCVIDHADMNTTNNSKENLRLALLSDNCCNRKISRNNTTGVKGIQIIKNQKYTYYSCQVNKNYKLYKKQFQYSPEGLELAKAWLEEKRKELHGEFARN